MKKQLTFFTAILTVLKDFREQKKSFSAYEVTRELRHRVNDGEYELLDKTPTDINGTMTYEIMHADVKDFVSSLWYADLMAHYRREVLTGTNYWTYVYGAPSVPVFDSTPQVNPVADTLAKGTVSSPTLIPSPSTIKQGRVGFSFNETAVEKYIEVRESLGIPATLRSIANRFRRDKVTIDDVESMVTGNPTFNIDWRTPRNQSVVTLV